ncbi:unnamed protein product [Schistosoma margrebowiei]|uniref:Uncharacterized protein n=1 Tax=Schistosoma margrebowiei TaxID=48269 RepID=A0A183N5W9_9TREM|nr:unnamed protein product [Schistosoma margrebowiei]
MWKLFKELTGDRQSRSDNQLNVCDLNKSFVRQSSDVMLPLSTGLNNSCVPIFAETDVRRCHRSLNSSRCLGPDGIPNILFKKCADVLCYQFTAIFNRSSSSNLIPKMWRKMKIIPVPKKASGDKNLYHSRIQPITACSLLLWRRSQSHYKVNLSTRDLVEVVNQKAKIHKYIKPQEPEKSLYVNSLERCDSEEDLNVISENDQLDFGALSADNVCQQPYNESVISGEREAIESVIDELLSTDEVEEDPVDCLRLSNVYRRHPHEHYCELIKRYCKAGDTNSALSVFFSEMLEKDRVLPSRFHAHMVLDGLARVGDSENAFRVYKKMTELGIDATQATYSRLFRLV